MMSTLWPKIDLSMVWEVQLGYSGAWVRNEVDHFGFYSHSTLGLCMYLVVYVNDIVITGNDVEGITKLKHHLFQHFQTQDLC